MTSSNSAPRPHVRLREERFVLSKGRLAAMEWVAMTQGVIRTLQACCPEKWEEACKWDYERPDGVASLDWPGFTEILGRSRPALALTERERMELDEY